MGDPKKPKKKYDTPAHPWQKKRIDDEKALVKEYGFKNKREIWKLHSWLRSMQRFAKHTITTTSDQVLKERADLLRKLSEYGLVGEGATVDDVLGLEVHDVLNRRLQTLVFRKGLARSMRQARQFIVHKHIEISGRKVTSPNYLVRVADETQISFSANSALADAAHPERAREVSEPAAEAEAKKPEAKKEALKAKPEPKKAEHNKEESKAAAAKKPEEKKPAAKQEEAKPATKAEPAPDKKAEPEKKEAA